jgi:GNAT superfamily N-acetyltransferase
VALEWKHTIDGVDWKELSALYRAAPLGDKKPLHLQTVFSNSMFRCFVYDNARLVAAGRALADGEDCSYICDIAVLPSHQGTGLGKQIVSQLVERSRAQEDHPLCRSGQGALLPKVWLPAYEHSHGHL